MSDFDAMYAGWRAAGHTVADAQALAQAEARGDGPAQDDLLASIKARRPMDTNPLHPDNLAAHSYALEAAWEAGVAEARDGLACAPPEGYSREQAAAYSDGYAFGRAYVAEALALAA